MGNAQPANLSAYRSPSAPPSMSPLTDAILNGTPSTHAVLGNVRYKVRELGWNPGGQVEQTLGVMRDRVGEDSRNPWFRQWAYYVVPSNADPDQVIQDAYGHVASSIQFARDEAIGAGIEGVGDEDVAEVIIRPIDMAYAIGRGKAVGDCDDFSMYLAAILEAHGIPCTFVTVAADGRAPDQFSHVYVAAYPPSGRIVLDASHGEYPGWEYGNPYDMYKEWPCCGNGNEWLTKTVIGGLSLLGLAYLVWGRGL